MGSHFWAGAHRTAAAEECGVSECAETVGVFSDRLPLGHRRRAFGTRARAATQDPAPADVSAANGCGVRYLSVSRDDDDVRGDVDGGSGGDAGGKAHVRVGVSLLTNVGIPEMIAQSEDEYVSIAVGLAKELPGLAELRAGLRGKMRLRR